MKINYTVTEENKIKRTRQLEGEKLLGCVSKELPGRYLDPKNI
jgi:hypothetical protein